MKTHMRLNRPLRECGSADNVAVVVAVGSNDDGYREVVGVEVFTSENETS